MNPTQPPASPPDDIIHPYVTDALDAARRGDLDALGWLESDCIAWALIDAETAALIDRQIFKPARKRRTRHEKTEATRRADNPKVCREHTAAKPGRTETKPGCYLASS